MDVGIRIVGVSLMMSLLGLTAAGSPGTQVQNLSPIQIISSHETRESDGLCTLRNNGDTIVSFYHGIVAGDRFATYIDPRKCAGSPQFPFAVQRIQIGLYTNYGGVWPVEVAFEVWLPAGPDSCSGPGTLVCADTVLLDEATFLLPHLGVVTLNHRCCITQPFFIVVEYTGATPSPYPSVTFDSRMPADSCLNWAYSVGYDWRRWNHYWWPPVPGNLVIWVEGDANSAVCGSTGCCVGVTGNVDGDAGDLVDVSDLTALVGYLFQGQTISMCADEDNVDGDPSGAVDIADLQKLVDFLFNSEALPGCP